MSKKAEQAAYNYAKKNGTLGYDYNQIYDAAKNGYEQAEKDNELTWEDIKLILELAKQVTYELRNWPYVDIEPWACNPVENEVLRRFNEIRKK